MIINKSLSVATKQNPYIKQKNNDILREIQSITSQVGSQNVNVRLIYSNNKIIKAIVSVKGEKDLKSKISSSNKIKVNFVETEKNEDENEKDNSINKENKKEDTSFEKYLPYKTYSYYTTT